ncbi:hypothetical protein RIF29_00123 [Crotalaria pallida]|uniref:Uncharacterized protein n=1 Tax=Crotalaria pallida TaxID=3830 RepID=A0AAN9P796_CROPI
MKCSPKLVRYRIYYYTFLNVSGIFSSIFFLYLSLYFSQLQFLPLISGEGIYLSVYLSSFFDSSFICFHCIIIR